MKRTTFNVIHYVSRIAQNAQFMQFTKNKLSAQLKYQHILPVTAPLSGYNANTAILSP